MQKKAGWQQLSLMSARISGVRMFNDDGRALRWAFVL